MAAFGRLAAHNVREHLTLGAGGASASSEATERAAFRKAERSAVLRFLAKLWSDKAAQLAEDANRDAHGGALRTRDAPLPARHYRRACELLAREQQQADEGGVRAFFRGWTPFFGRLAPLSLISLPLYEQIRRRVFGLEYLE